MKLSYFPGCTLKNHAKNFEDSALCSLKVLGVEVEELPRWNCCGTVFSLATDDLIHHVAPIRNLLRAKQQKSDKLLTLCAMCFNTLKRSNERMRSEPENLEVINDLMYKEEGKYEGEVDVVHLLEVIKDTITLEGVKRKVVKPLSGLKVASYYGCYLVRPADIGFDNPENPTIMDNLVETLGGTPVDFPYKTECCGAYQTVDKPEVVAERTHQILSSAQDQGADVVIVSCPLCAFNLDQRQKETAKKFPDFKHIPILYFSQLMSIALGCAEESLKLDLHYINPRPILEGKGLL
jgi:heterodisulfide reductase subunit B